MPISPTKMPAQINPSALIHLARYLSIAYPRNGWETDEVSVKKVTSNPADAYDRPEDAMSTGRNGGSAFMYISSTMWPAVNVARMLRSESCDFIYTFLRRANLVNMVSCASSRLKPRDWKRETVVSISILFTSTDGS